MKIQTRRKNAWGCEIYPKSIYNLLLALNAEYPKHQLSSQKTDWDTMMIW